jgi:thiol-disulfide isomerase/thioredoxin
MSDDPRTRDHTSSTAPVSAASGRPGLLRSLAHHLAGDPDVLPVEGQLPPFDGATGWLNSEPLTPEGLRGRVVLVDFWTYTCINWLRTAPYVKAWDAKYRDLGLAVIGVHTPEFGFEHDLNNVTARSREFGGEYPIAVDSDYRVWQAFDNHFWPALYVADPDGRIRYHHFGEGEYAMAEMVIQQLLLEAGVQDVDPGLVSVEPRGFEVPADWATLRSPETYLAFDRSAGFASPERARFNAPYRYPYPEPSGLSLNEWAPVGTWTLAQHAAVRPVAVSRSGSRPATSTS